MKKLILAGVAISHLAGCVSYASGSLIHQSQPGVGKGPWPIGDNYQTQETGFDGIELGVGWEKGLGFAEVNVIYAVREGNIAGGPWITTFRTGVRVRK